MNLLCRLFGHKRSDFLMPYDCTRLSCRGDDPTPCVGVRQCTYSHRCRVHATNSVPEGGGER